MPLPTGSPLAAMTMGTVPVAFLAAITASVPRVTIKSTFRRSSSAASCGKRSGRPSRPNGSRETYSFPPGRSFPKNRIPLVPQCNSAFRPRDQRVLERFEAGLGPEDGGKKLLSGLRRQRIQPKLRVVGAAAPTVLIFWAVVHDQQQPGSRQALNENIEQCLSLGHPLEVESGGRPCCRCRPILHRSSRADRDACDTQLDTRI
jgi:hypothetical protein